MAALDLSVYACEHHGMDKTTKKKVLIAIPVETLEMIDDFRASERPVRNRNAAILSLIVAGSHALGVVRNG